MSLFTLSVQKNIKQKVELFQQLIEQLPTPNKLLLSWMIVHMTHVIAKVGFITLELPFKQWPVKLSL